MDNVIQITLDFTPENVKKLAAAFCSAESSETVSKSQSKARKVSNTFIEAATENKTGPNLAEASQKTDDAIVFEAAVITITDLSSLAGKLIQEGRQAEIKSIFAKFGANKLTDIPEKDYPGLKIELVKLLA